MSSYPPENDDDAPLPPTQPGQVDWPAVPTEPEQPRHRARSILWPVGLFLVTCYSTYSAYRTYALGGVTNVAALYYALAIMFTLLTHELGHFIQALRYRVPATLPFFIPMPFSPVGTMGAVIAMQPRTGDRRAMFDIGITGPLAGLVPALVFSIIGLHWSHVVDLQNVPASGGGLRLGEPLLFKLLSYLTFGPLPTSSEVYLHPLAYAGWVGLFITALNLIPIGQLDGGHILYALLRQRAHVVAQLLLAGAMVGVVLGGYWGWTLMILLLMLMGPRHPPTANDEVPLGTTRTILGWATLCFVPIGFTPTPFVL